MIEKNRAVSETIRTYLGKIAKIDYSDKTDILGVTLGPEGVVAPFYGEPYTVGSDRIFDSKGKDASHSIGITLCKYLLMYPLSEPLDDSFASYKDFRDAAPFVGSFTNHTEKAVAAAFSGKLEELTEACRRVGGRPFDEGLGYQLTMRFDALPKIPVFLLFNDEDEEFPAQCTFLFERRAEKYLDMECLAITGWVLADYLIRASGRPSDTVM